MSDPVLKYGVHAGKRVSELPEDYVMWWADRTAALAENHVARAICERVRTIAARSIGDYEPGRGMYGDYDHDDSVIDDEWRWDRED